MVDSHMCLQDASNDEQQDLKRIKARAGPPAQSTDNEESDEDMQQ